jgi:hypothetical protein
VAFSPSIRFAPNRSALYPVAVIAMQSGKKRRIQDEDSDRSTDCSASSQPASSRNETVTSSIPYIAQDCASSESTSRHTTIHHVECSGAGRHHEHHDHSADYLDVPFLPAHSNRMTGLRGQNRLADLESYIEDRVNLSFVVYMTYDCVAYHEDIKASFERITVPHLDEAIAYQAKPYFYVLREDAQPARSRSEKLLPSESLHKVLKLLRGARERISGMEERRDDEFLRNLVYPYLKLYHERKVLIEYAKSQIPTTDQIHLTALFNYLENRLGAEYTEAEVLFNQGVVNRKHWAKLFIPGAMVVSHKSNEPVAYVSTSCEVALDGSLHLKCWSWAFESKFFKNEVDLVVSWPSEKDTIAIIDLPTYPLEHAPTGLEQELRCRGEVFWGCRLRKFVNYDVPLKGMAVQKVSVLDVDSMREIANTDRPI